MTGLAVLDLLPPRATFGGSTDLTGTDLVELMPKQMNLIRGRRVSMVFQDPSTSLHPMLSIVSQLTDHIRYHLKVSQA